MQTQWTPETLLAFEEDIAQCFARGEIRAPIHLAGGNEQQLIDIFSAIEPDDWVLGAWRAHYHSLLKGVPADDLRRAILAGRSISLAFPEHKVLCSAIVGGIAPIATGLAWSIKQRGGAERVHCFIGDMTMQTGIVHEAMTYVRRHNLPVRWIVEDNGKSVCTDTQEAWGHDRRAHPDLTQYRYHLSRVHSGIGQWVRF